LLSYVITQRSFSFVKPLSKTLNGGSILFSFLAVFFALLQLNSKSVRTFVAFRQISWKNGGR
jgi:hypothetical protein